MTITGCHEFRVTRDSDLWVDEEEVDDLLKALKGELPNRHYGDAVRLEVADTCPGEISDYLLDQFKLKADDLYRVDGPVNLYRLLALHRLVDRPDLKYPPHLPSVPAPFKRGSNPFDVLRRRDILLHLPYQSMAPVIELARAAAADPDVLAIKQTLYRTGASSPFVAALIDAARAGKEVTAVVELKARFDEAANIDLATRLQQAGVTVVYGVVSYKTHAKMLMIVRREAGQLRRYVHLGTGNYHAETARAYTDLGLLTSDRAIGEDVNTLFLQLTGIGRVKPLKKLIQAPFGLHKQVIARIDAEADAAARGKPARIIAKMNSLLDPEVIRALYRASQAGVEVDLIVRGICGLRAGVPGISDRIRVRSVVGRFLEHSRVWYFEHGGDPEVFASSADWMPRNFFSRVEVAFPIEDEDLRRRVVDECLMASLADNCESWLMNPDATWERQTPGDGQRLSVQAGLIDAYED
jgi:polyphosphate kinase